MLLSVHGFLFYHIVFLGDVLCTYLDFGHQLIWNMRYGLYNNE